MSRKDLQPHLSRFVNEQIQQGHKALNGPPRSNSVSLEEVEDVPAAIEVPTEEELAEEEPASSRCTTQGVPASTGAGTEGGSRVTTEGVEDR